MIAGDLSSKLTDWGGRVINPNGYKLQTAFIGNCPYTQLFLLQMDLPIFL